MWTLLLNSLLLTAWLAECHPAGQPHVQLGDTTIIGKHLQPSNLEFFGGWWCSPILTQSLFLTSHFQVSILPSLQLTTFAFHVRGQSILSPPYRHLTLVTTVHHACSHSSPLWIGLQPAFHHNCSWICQKTVLLLTYLGLPVSMLTPLCPSWSGFMGEASYVRSRYPTFRGNSFFHRWCLFNL